MFYNVSDIIVTIITQNKCLPSGVNFCQVSIVSLTVLDALCIDVVTYLSRANLEGSAENTDSIACAWPLGWLHDLRHQPVPASSQRMYHAQQAPCAFMPAHHSALLAPSLSLLVASHMCGCNAKPRACCQDCVLQTWQHVECSCFRVV